jgi:hypothetical protein
MNRALPSLPSSTGSPVCGRVGVGPDWLAVIQGHSDPNGNRLCHAIADAYPKVLGSPLRELRRVAILYPASLIIGKKRAKTRLAAGSRTK